jgi:hypothetical protein
MKEFQFEQVICSLTHTWDPLAGFFVFMDLILIQMHLSGASEGINWWGCYDHHFHLCFWTKWKKKNPLIFNISGRHMTQKIQKKDQLFLLLLEYFQLKWNLSDIKHLSGREKWRWSSFLVGIPSGPFSMIC